MLPLVIGTSRLVSAADARFVIIDTTLHRGRGPRAQALQDPNTRNDRSRRRPARSGRSRRTRVESLTGHERALPGDASCWPIENRNEADKIAAVWIEEPEKGRVDPEQADRCEADKHDRERQPRVWGSQPSRYGDQMTAPLAKWW